MARQTLVEMKVRAELEHIDKENTEICEEFIRITKQLQRMEDFMLEQEKELAGLRSNWRRIEKILGDFWDLKMDVLALRRGQDPRRLTEKDGEELESASSTPDAPKQGQ